MISVIAKKNAVFALLVMILVLVCFQSIFFSKKRTTSVLFSSPLRSELISSFASIGNKSFAADIYWLYAVFKLGDDAKKNRLRDFSEAYPIQIQKLSPSFQGIYEFFGTIVAHSLKKPRLAAKYLELGVEEVSRNDTRYWLVPFYLGFIYFNKLGDSQKGAYYLSLASKYEGSPPYLPFLSATLYADSGSLEESLSVVNAFLNRTQNPMIKRSLEDRKRKIEHQIYARNNAGITAFKQKFLTLPLSMDLVRFLGLLAKDYDEVADPVLILRN